jgi:hypothetical protein
VRKRKAANACKAALYLRDSIACCTQATLNKGKQNRVELRAPAIVEVDPPSWLDAAMELTCESLVISGLAPHFARSLSKPTNKGSTHAVTTAKSRFLRHDFDGVTAFFDHHFSKLNA